MSNPQFNFRANARLMDVVGRELINDDNIAVAELVKNAIDASASRVDIVFDGAKEGVCAPDNGRIIIADNGKGMDTDDIRDKWLNIAYSEKRALIASGKFMAGNKGIGRFSCDRLGLRLRLLAMKRGHKTLSLEIDWEKFEVDDKDKGIESVPLLFREDATPDEFCMDLPAQVSGEREQGVILVMSQLRSAWDKKKILVLRRLLEKMVSPYDDLLDNPGCRVFLHAQKLDGKPDAQVKNRVFDKLGFEATSVESRIADGGALIETKIRDRGRTVVQVVERNPYPPLKDVRVFLHYMNQYKKAMFKRETGVSTLEFGSIFLFLNGFRVPPYGDRGNDWLSLDNRKAQGVMRNIGARNILGRIEVRDLEGAFRVLTSREGVVDNDAYRALVNVDRVGLRASYRGYFYDVFTRLETYVVQGLDWDKLRADVNNRDLRDMADKRAQDPDIYILRESERDRRILQALGGIARGSDESRIISVIIDPRLLEKLREESREEDQARTAKVVNYLGGRLLEKGVFPQDQARMLGDIRDHFEKQERRIASLAESREKERTRAEASEESLAVERAQKLFYKDQVTSEMEGVWDMSHELSTKVLTLKENIEALDAILGSNAPDGAGRILRGMRREVEEMSTLCDYIVNRNFKDAYKEDVHDIPEFLRRRYEFRREQDESIGEISLPPEGETAFACAFSPMDMTMVLDNLLDNARKAAKKRFGLDRKPNIRMDVSVDDDKRELVLRVSDDAGGLDDSIKDPDNIFKMKFTKTGGMGLGLHIAREIVEGKWGGKIRCVPRKGGTIFEIRIPKR